MEEDKLYFTEITENEKRIINLIRTYVAPLSSVENYLDFLVDDVIHKLLEKAVRLRAFTEVMQHERGNENSSNIEILAKINQFENFIQKDETTMKKCFNYILSDIISNLEGDIKPIESYSSKNNLEEEEKTLDKIQELWYTKEKVDNYILK